MFACVANTSCLITCCELTNHSSPRVNEPTFHTQHLIFHQLPIPNQMPPHQMNLCASSCSIYLHAILLFSIWLLCLQPTIITTAPTNETDRLALLKFKESVTHDPYKILSSWNNSMHFCNWLGITCGRRHQRVTRLDLPSYQLHGSISPYIGNLTFLMVIHLYNNSFYGEIPQKMGHLFRLQSLVLSLNMLEGEIPSSLSNCSNLMVIRIASNKLKGRIPSELGCLMKLEGLVIHENNLTGGIPPSLGNLSSATFLDIGRNNLGGKNQHVVDNMGFKSYYIYIYIYPILKIKKKLWYNFVFFMCPILNKL